ncbi:MAG: hypothetical protein EOP04_16465, partial [Proteobacteria bacterium]
MKYLMTTALLLSIVACSDVEPAKQKPSADTIGERAIMVRKPLKEAEIAEVSNFFARTKLLPSIEIYIANPQETKDDQERRQKEIKKLAGYGRQLHDQIIAKCVFEAPVMNVEGNLQKPESVQKITTAAKITGDDCPIDVTESKQKTTTVTATNYPQIQEQFKKDRNEQLFKELDQTGNSVTNDQWNLIVKDPSLQKQSGLASQQTTEAVQVSFTGPTYRSDFNSHVKTEVKATQIDGSV